MTCIAFTCSKQIITNNCHHLFLTIHFDEAPQIWFHYYLLILNLCMNGSYTDMNLISVCCSHIAAFLLYYSIWKLKKFYTSCKKTENARQHQQEYSILIIADSTSNLPVNTSHFIKQLNWQGLVDSELVLCVTQHWDPSVRFSLLSSHSLVDNI